MKKATRKLWQLFNIFIGRKKYQNMHINFNITAINIRNQSVVIHHHCHHHHHIQVEQIQALDDGNCCDTNHSISLHIWNKVAFNCKVSMIYHINIILHKCKKKLHDQAFALRLEEIINFTLSWIVQCQRHSHHPYAPLLARIFFSFFSFFSFFFLFFFFKGDTFNSNCCSKMYNLSDIRMNLPEVFS